MEISDFVFSQMIYRVDNARAVQVQALDRPATDFEGLAFRLCRFRKSEVVQLHPAPFLKSHLQVYLLIKAQD